ncbi:RidA family protein [Mesorhizobium sp. YM1C-6-2]|jgi:enamine deaminase RidA (YjgF/YER057c/UK114 family)|uniref:RidA family protein n=1 Tax=Mesorhizobium sp. YM1C-6-2 TaxID=1827501 RepID=UPI000EF20A46|nr:RidA family protein [Mesorhizobium sp. YM1C-6-2]RLP26934.1 RidA family protein [Mesorhizobium sp. YM1C-6-2]
MSITRHHKNARMSQGVSWNGMFVTSAQVAKDFDLDAAGQTREVLDKIDALLAEQGYDKSNIVSATIWLADIADYAAMNSVWDAWVSTDEPPARACVEARFSSPRIKVEIQIMAAG